MALSLDKVQKGARRKKTKDLDSKTQNAPIILEGTLKLKTSRPWVEKTEGAARIQKYTSKRTQDISLEEAREMVAPDIREDWLLGAIEELQFQKEILKIRDHFLHRATELASRLPFAHLLIEQTHQWIARVEGKSSK